MENSNIQALDILGRHGVRNDFLLYVGNAYPHKNLEGLIKIWPQLKKENKNLQLVLVGKDDYFYERVKLFAEKYNKDGQSIIFPGFLPDKDLIYFYQNALAYIFPSRYEGFGLPPLEAMAQGCPVISSNQASMPEILGEAAVYFDPDKEDEMIEVISKIINDPPLRSDLRVKGLEQVEKYSWEKCASETLNIYKDFLDS